MGEDLNEARIVKVDIESEMRKSYLDYAMSVIIGAPFLMCGTG